MRIPKLRRDVKSEVVRPVQLFVAQPHHLAVSLLYDCLGQHRFDGRVEFLEHVLPYNVRAVVDMNNRLHH